MIKLIWAKIGLQSYTANPRALQRESMQPLVNAQVTHSQCELCMHHPEKPGLFPKGSEERPHMHGNSICAFLPSGTGARGSKMMGKCWFYPIVTLNLDVPKPPRFKPKPDFPSNAIFNIKLLMTLMLIPPGVRFM